MRTYCDTPFPQNHELSDMGLAARHSYDLGYRQAHLPEDEIVPVASECLQRAYNIGRADKLAEEE